MEEEKSSQASNNGHSQVTVNTAYTQAIHHFNAERYTEADQLCTAIIQAAPNNIDAINLLGVIAQKVNRHDLAVEQFQRAINIDNSRPLLYYNLGVSLHALGRNREVIQVLKFVAEKIPRKTHSIKLYQYLKPDGTFDYERYKTIQINGNRSKIKNVWVKEKNIAFLSAYINRNVPNTKFGLCHGTRRGKEQEWFNKYLRCEVLGTEISDTAEQFPDTIQWDFHEVKPEWIRATDFIYSNSFDHSYNPEKCLNAWMSCLKKGGICIIEHTSDHERATELDPFGAEISHMPYVILMWGKGKYCVHDILDYESNLNPGIYIKYLIIKNT